MYDEVVVSLANLSLLSFKSPASASATRADLPVKQPAGKANIYLEKAII